MKNKVILYAYLFINLSPSILQPYRTVEYHLVRGRVGVYVEVADTLELEISQWPHASSELLDVEAGQHLQRVGADDFLYRC